MHADPSGQLGQVVEGHRTHEANVGGRQGAGLLADARLDHRGDRLYFVEHQGAHDHAEIVHGDLVGEGDLVAGIHGGRARVEDAGTLEHLVAGQRVQRIVRLLADQLHVLRGVRVDEQLPVPVKQADFVGHVDVIAVGGTRDFNLVQHGIAAGGRHALDQGSIGNGKAVVVPHDHLLAAIGSDRFLFGEIAMHMILRHVEREPRAIVFLRAYAGIGSFQHVCVTSWSGALFHERRERFF